MAVVVNVGQWAGRLATSPAESDTDVNNKWSVWAVVGGMLVKGTLSER